MHCGFNYQKMSVIYFSVAKNKANFMQEFSEELQKRRKGKSCFYFKKPTEVTAELDQLLKKGYDSFQQKNWL